MRNSNPHNAFSIAETALATKYDPDRHAEIQEARYEAINTALPYANDSALTEAILKLISTTSKSRIDAEARYNNIPKRN